jgi:putative transposase
MLYRNDLFHLDNMMYRLLHVSPEQNLAWVIAMDVKHAWPKAISWSSIEGLERETWQNEHGIQRVQKATPTQQRRAREAFLRIQPLVSQVPGIFNRNERAQLVRAHESCCNCTSRTLWAHLRLYWQGGQTVEALLGNLHKSGRASINHTTANRGRRPIYSDRAVYQLTESDIRNFESAIKHDYLKDERRSIAASFAQMLSNAYTSLDGNCNSWLLDEGQRPTQRQYEHYLRSRYGIEVRLRSRKGDKEFEREHRAKLGSVMQDCLGVGHIYEIDATIVDIYLVSSDDARKIIGKPTLYLIIDRKSRLIAGYYLGLENASWIGAMQAILSIPSNKASLCRTLGVKYNPSDWPAEGVLPQEFFADRGEMLSAASNQLTQDLGVTVTNMPGLRPDWKPLVECGFKLMHQQLATVAPAYNPDANAKKRRGKHYEQDACLTLADLSKIVLEAIIASTLINADPPVLMKPDPAPAR